MNWVVPYQSKRDRYWPEVEAFFSHLPPHLFQQGVLLKNNLATFYTDSGQFKDMLGRERDHQSVASLQRLTGRVHGRGKFRLMILDDLVGISAGHDQRQFQNGLHSPRGRGFGRSRGLTTGRSGQERHGGFRVRQCHRRRIGTPRRTTPSLRRTITPGRLPWATSTTGSSLVELGRMSHTGNLNLRPVSDDRQLRLLRQPVDRCHRLGLTRQRSPGDLRTSQTGENLTESIPADLRKSAYALKVAGKSMENPAFANSIPDGSVIVVVNKPAKIGDIVVGLVDGHSTLKLLIEEKKRKLLRSLNPHPRFQDIIPLSSLEIQGVFHAIAG